MKRAILLGALVACTGPERANQLYAYEYTYETPEEVTRVVVVHPGRHEHHFDQWSARKLKPYDGTRPAFASWTDTDLDGEPDELVSTVEQADGSYLQFWDREADGDTDRTHRLDERGNKLEERFFGGYSLYSYDNMDRLLTAEVRAGNLVLDQGFSYLLDAPDWIGQVRESGSTTDQELDRVVLRRELGPHDRWVAAYSTVDGEPEELDSERTLDDKARVLTHTDFDEDTATTATNTWEGDFIATREVDVDGEALWRSRWTQDEAGYPVLQEDDDEADGIYDHSYTSTYEVDEYGRLVLEVIEDDETGEVVYRYERVDLGPADEADLDPWRVQPRPLDDYE